jgi:hypothetical protein
MAFTGHAPAREIDGGAPPLAPAIRSCMPAEAPCEVLDLLGSRPLLQAGVGMGTPPVFAGRAVLRDGTKVCMGAIRPDDKERLRIAFEHYRPKASINVSSTR